MCTEMDYECDFGYSRHFTADGSCELEVKKSTWDSKMLQLEEE